MARLYLHADFKWLALRALLIVTVGLWIYAPTFHGGWLWDDDLDFARNPITLSPAGWWMNWIEPGHLSAYYPIKGSVQWIQWRLWHNDTLGYHLTNVLLHLCSALLVWRLLSKIGLRLAWLGGLIFAIHPLMVESVAWIAELKNTISLPPFLLALCAWIDYDERGNRRDYLTAMGWFLIAMLGKITMAAFPVVILLYAWWKRRRIAGSDFRAGAPFWAISLVLGLITLRLQQNHVLASHVVAMGGFPSRLASAGLAITFYLCKAVWPVGLLPVYSRWNVDSPALWQFLPWPILGAMLWWFWSRRESWGRHALLGLGFFLINLGPVIGFILLKYETMVWSLDHLVYLPLIGLIGMAVAGLELIDRRLSPALHFPAIGVVAIVVMLLARESERYAAVFVNQETLWAYTLKSNPEAWPAYNNLGIIFLRRGQLAEAMEEFSAALKIAPDDTEAQNGLGNALVLSGRVAESIPYYEKALKYDPSNSEVHNGLGNALLQTGRLAEAKTQCEEALRLDPDYVEAHCTLGLILVRLGNLPAAIDHFQIAHRLDPANAKIEQGLEWLFSLQKQAAGTP